jgi:hypothetical protein
MTTGLVSVTAVDATQQAGTGSGQRLIVMGYASNAANALERYLTSASLVSTRGNGLPVEVMGKVLAAKGDQLFYSLSADTQGVASAVAQSGSGPLITVAGNPTGKFTVKVKVTKAATTDSGNARVKIATDGYTYGEEIQVKPRTAAELVGTVDMTLLTLSTLNGKHFTCTGDDAAVGDVTMSSPPASVTALITELNAGLVTDASNCTVLTTLRAGKYLVAKSGTLGSTSTISAAAGDGMDELGLNGQSGTGTNSTFLIPGTGLTITFPTGTWVLDEIYTFTTTAPIVSLTTFRTAIAALPRDGSVDFSAVAIVQDWADEHDADTYIEAIRGDLAAWQTSEPYKVVGLVSGMPLGTPGISGQATNDTAIRVKFASRTSQWCWIAVGDCYVSGFSWLGSYRHSALTAKLIQMVSLDESRSIGEREAGAVVGISMTGPDGTTLARDEWTATVQMDDRFSVLCKEAGAPFFKTGRTLATSPGFNELAWTRPFAHAIQLTHDRLRNKLELTAPTDPAGKLLESIAKGIDHAVNGPLGIEILNPPGARPRASGCVFRYDRTNIFSTTKSLPGTLTFQVLGIAHTASIASTMVSEIPAT